MKGRSQRLPPAEPPDDWGDGSWTVDCSCGVTFDDGEEMVSCDECGVWVHTRCSRYVRGEASFACHNCKAAARRLRSASAAAVGHFPLPVDTEETEVAQLLVELPTKTDVCPPPPPPPLQPADSAAGPHRRRLWAEIPLEDRVHVQGVPGGEPNLFGGLSSIFTSQLWKCTGYVPKKFNFRYREFPCWEEDEEKKEGEEEAENPANRGADVLFSLSKEIIPYVPVKKFDAAIKEGEGKVSSGSRSSLSCRKKDRSRLRTVGQANVAKKRREEPGETKDWTGKKKARSSAEKIAGDTKRRGSVPFTGMKKFEFQKDKDLQLEETSVPGPKSEDQTEELHSASCFAGQPKGMGHSDKPKHLLADSSMIAREVKVEKVDQLETVKTEKSDNSPKMDVASRGGTSQIAKESSTDEVSSRAMYCMKEPKDESNFEGRLAKVSSSVVMDSGTSKPASADLANGCKELLDKPVLSGSKDAVILSTKMDANEVKIEGADDLSTGNLNFTAPCTAAKLPAIDSQQHGQLLNQLSEGIQDQENKSSFPSHGHWSQDVSRECNEFKDSITSRTGELLKHCNQVENSAEQKGTLEIGHGTKNFNESTNSRLQDLNSLIPDAVNLAVGVIKDSSTSFSPVVTKLSVPCTNMSSSTSTSSAGKASHLTKQARAKVSTNTAAKKEGAPTPAGENMGEILENPAKGQSKVSLFSGSRPSKTSRTSYDSASEHLVSDSKEELPFQSSKASGKEDRTAVLRTHDVAGSLQSQVASVQIKQTSTNLSQRTERSHQSAPYTSSKVLSTSIFMHPSASSNATTTLSDEELALLLHQELNSSPRVPRVPRVRQAAGIQSTPTTGMSVLSKRPSVSGGKDQVSVFRRKNKEDASKYVTRNSQELNDESRKKGRLSSFPDQRHQQSSISSEKKKESQIRPPDLALMKNISLASGEGEKSDPFSSSEVSEHITSIACSSPRDIPRDEGGVIVRTLPGLIDEIMSKDKHIRYEELCNAVRPHWHDLRKPNGERYAYPSYLHAVHDCLRNRSEWAHLIDQGPKTNSSKKRRKAEVDPDVATIESENEKARTRASKEEDNAVDSHREDFPKRKRNARKRRRLELRGTGVMEEGRKRRSRAAVSDYYSAALSHSSNEGNESLFSEDESQVAGPHAGGTETSSSSSDDST
ncbi:uncharacterized protein LOC135612737 isoform X1 [Musa acuminata AAA Group]|uniref:uncharacterized protein LOC135612737 isoform X1 n=1 Tax=Musa acuminata AAA Group TaxID=214697 RepID=UPI0031E00718